jgi:fructose 1,6-bisphosphatase
VSTTRLHHIAGKYTGKDDPVLLTRVQKNFPATGELLAPYSIARYVGGFMRGSHVGPLMPVPHGTGCSYFDGPPIVSAWGSSVRASLEPVQELLREFRARTDCVIPLWADLVASQFQGFELGF